MKRFWVIVPVAVLFLLPTTTLSAGEKSFSAILRGNYTTTSKVFFAPNAPSQEQRGQYFELEGITGAGAELRYHWPGESFFLSLSVDYLVKSREQRQPVAYAPQYRVPVVEGLRLVPVELGVHTFIPLGSETMRLSMGGGISAYYGERILRVAHVEAAMQNKPMKVGIHIASGFEYRIIPGLWLRGDMKFRDPELRTASRFTQSEVEYEGIVVPLPQNELSSRINVDGLAFSLGVVIEVW
ncbi:MAG: hypothetical protein ACRDGA_06075 [Bacteroidota bacterium]